MAQAPPGGGGPTGNPLSDANLVSIGTAGVQIDPATAANVINSTNQQISAVASDCLWPPAGQITFPIIPGLFHQTVHIPCLVSYSEARALAGAGILIGGLLVLNWGFSILAVAGVLKIAGAVVGGGGGKSSKSGAAAEGAAAPAASEVALAA